MKVGSQTLRVGESFECIGVYDYPEDYSYTPDMSLTLRVDGGSEQSLYEVRVTLGSQKNRIVAKGLAVNGEMTTLYFDASQFSAAHMSDHLKISVRCLTDGAEECSVWLYSLSGHSTEYFSEELSEKIEARRTVIRNTDVAATGGWNYTLVTSVIGIIVIMIVVGIGMHMAFKRDDHIKENEDDE
jgi:hypothetical protein